MSSQIKIKKRGEGFKNFLKKYGYFIAVGIIVLAVTLSIILTNGVKTSVDEVSNLDMATKEPVEVGSVGLNFALPMENCEVVHDYSRNALIYNESMGWFETHKGVDLKSNNSKVYACEAGEVVKVYTNTLEGTVVEIKHDGNMTTKYSSLASDVLVKVGDKVKKGQQIGVASNSAGEEVQTGAHLHFELLNGDNQVNPNDYLSLSNK